MYRYGDQSTRCTNGPTKSVQKRSWYDCTLVVLLGSVNCLQSGNIWQYIIHSSPKHDNNSSACLSPEVAWNFQEHSFNTQVWQEHETCVKSALHGTWKNCAVLLQRRRYPLWNVYIILYNQIVFACWLGGDPDSKNQTSGIDAASLWSIPHIYSVFSHLKTHALEWTWINLNNLGCSQFISCP